MINRRRFLTGSSLAAAGAVSFPNLATARDPGAHRNGERPRHIIHMVADGMSTGTLTCADHFSSVTRERGLSWMGLYRKEAVFKAWMNMRSLNSLVTDSSAASSSWGSGTRIINGMVNTLGDGTWLKPLYELLREAGWQRGLVTTTEITHATPAGFATNAVSRDHGDIIAAQYLDRRVDVLLGGGRKFFKADTRDDKRDLKGDFSRANYVVMDHKDQLMSAPMDQRWLGTFAEEHLPFSVDHRHNPRHKKQVPTLAEMTALALKKLEQSSRFILQVEGGRVDHACHNCDAPSALNDMIAFDEAIDVCLEFQRRQPETLILITTDHGNGNPGLNATGDGYGESTWRFADMTQVRASYPEMFKLLKRKGSSKPDDLDVPWFNGRLNAPVDGPGGDNEITATVEEIMEIIREGTGAKVAPQRARLFSAHLRDKIWPLYEKMNDDNAQLGQLLANHFGMGWVGHDHTSDYVPLVALGPGAELFNGFIENTDVFGHYLKLAKIDFRNPSEPLIMAGPEANTVENTREYARI